MTDQELIFKKYTKILTEDASHNDITDNLYTFLESLKPKYPQEEEAINHWLLRIDEEVSQASSIATIDSTDGGIEEVSNALQTMISLVGSS